MGNLNMIKDIDKVFNNWYKNKYNNEEIKFKDILIDLTKKSLKSLNEVINIQKGRNKQIRLTTKIFRSDEREYVKNYKVSDIENKLYFETSLSDIEIYNTNGDFSLIKDNKQNNKGIFVPKGSILQSKVRPYQKNFIQFFNDDILVSSAFLIFYNSSQNINNYVYNIFNSFQYNQYVINKQDTSGTYPTIDFDTWNDFEITIPNKIEYIKLINEFFTDETDDIQELTKKAISETKKYKEELVYSIFNQNNISNIEEVKEQQDKVFDNWKDNFKDDNGNYIIQLEKERNNIEEDIEYENVDISGLNFSDIEFDNSIVSNISNYISIKNQSDNDLTIYGVTNKDGGKVLCDKEIEKTTLRTKGNKGYKLIKENDVIWNPSRINVGSIGIMNNKEGCISTLYEIIELKENNHINYFKLYISSNLFKNKVNENMNNQTRPSFKYKNIFENFNFYIPKQLVKDNLKLSSYQLQQIIAKFIEDEADNIITELIKLNNDLSKYKEELLYIIFNNK